MSCDEVCTVSHWIGWIRVWPAGAGLAVWLVIAACGGSSGSSAPTAPAAVQSTAWSVSGRVVALDSGNGVGGATITPNWSLAPMAADGDGNYKLADSNTPPSTPLPVSVSSDGMISHDVFLSWTHGPRTAADVSMIHDTPPFSMDFYRQLVRGTYDHTADGAPFPIIRWTIAPSFFVRTVDQNGDPIEDDVIAAIEDGIQRAVSAWSVNQFTVATITTGTDVRPARSGWINVNVRRDPSETRVCGMAQVGANPGSITFNEGVCDCPSVKGIPGTLIVHEVGHAMGFYHVGYPKSTMYPYIQPGCGPGAPTSIESFHAGIAYSRPPGNTDPDRDPTAAPLSVRNRQTEICPKPPR